MAVCNRRARSTPTLGRLFQRAGRDMTITKFVHEGGLTSRSASESREISEKYGAQPVLAIETRPTGDLDLLLSRGGRVLGVQASSLYSPGTSDVALLFKTFALAYDVGAALHHCVTC